MGMHRAPEPDPRPSAESYAPDYDRTDPVFVNLDAREPRPSELRSGTYGPPRPTDTGRYYTTPHRPNQPLLGRSSEDTDRHGMSAVVFGLCLILSALGVCGMAYLIF